MDGPGMSQEPAVATTAPPFFDLELPKVLLDGAGRARGERTNERTDGSVQMVLVLCFGTNGWPCIAQACAWTIDRRHSTWKSYH